MVVGRRRDLTRHDANLARIYRKYWRRSSSNSPEAEVAFAILGSAGMHHMKRSMSRHMLNNNNGRGNGGPSRRGPPVERTTFRTRRTTRPRRKSKTSVRWPLNF